MTFEQWFKKEYGIPPKNWSEWHKQMRRAFEAGEANASSRYHVVDAGNCLIPDEYEKEYDYDKENFNQYY